MGFYLREPTSSTVADHPLHHPPARRSVIRPGSLASKEPHRGPTSSRILSSKYRDRESYLYYYGFRYYAPQVGRWTRRDPVEEGGPAGSYRMVRNQPTCLVDARGLALAHPSPGAVYRAEPGTRTDLPDVTLKVKHGECTGRVTVRSYIQAQGGDPPVPVGQPIPDTWKDFLRVHQPGAEGCRSGQMNVLAIFGWHDDEKCTCPPVGFIQEKKRPNDTDWVIDNAIFDLAAGDPTLPAPPADKKWYPAGDPRHWLFDGPSGDNRTVMKFRSNLHLVLAGNVPGTRLARFEWGYTKQDTGRTFTIPVDPAYPGLTVEAPEYRIIDAYLRGSP
jgi:RHS repeat-associated protein